MHLPVLLLWEEGGHEHCEHTFTLNLSWFGCAVRSHKFFSPGTRVRLQRQDKTVEARVAYSLWDHATNIVEVGLGFDHDGRDFWGIAVWAE